MSLKANLHVAIAADTAATKEKWMQVTADSLVKGQVVAQVDADCTVEAACEILVKKRVSSLPIYDQATQSFIGMFDLHTLAKYLLEKIGTNEKGKEVSFSKQTREDETSGSSDDVKKVVEFAEANPFYGVIPESTVAQITELFGNGAHRVAVMREDGGIDGILSQSTLMQYFIQHADDYPELQRDFDRSLDDLGLARKPVATVHSDTTLAVALSTLTEQHLSSMAIVDENGGMLGNLSLSDVKYICLPGFGDLLWGTCMEVVQRVRYAQGILEGQDRAAVFSVRPRASLRYTMSKMEATKVHQIWVTMAPDDDGGASGSENELDERTKKNTVANARNFGGSPISPCSPILGSRLENRQCYAGVFGDVVCGIVSLTDVLRIALLQSPTCN